MDNWAQERLPSPEVVKGHIMQLNDTIKAYRAAYENCDQLKAIQTQLFASREKELLEKIKGLEEQLKLSEENVKKLEEKLRASKSEKDATA